MCVSRLICHLFFDFGKPTIDHCCVPHFPNGRRTSPSLSYHSFPLSSELRKHWLVALRRDEGANSRVSASTVLCSERFLRKIFAFILVPKSLWTLPLPIMTKQGRLVASWKQMQCHRSCAIGVFFSFFLFFCARNLKSPCAGLQWNERWLRSRERHGPERKRAVDSRWPNDETTLYRKLAEHERLQRKRSNVWFDLIYFTLRKAWVLQGSADRERPTRDARQHAVSFKQDCRKSKAILVGLRSCTWEVWGITSRRGREKK